MAVANPMRVASKHCDAKLRGRPGKTCRQAAGWGTGHPGAGRCRLHGGVAPQVELVAAVEEARTDADRFGRSLPAHPVEAILEAIAFANGEVQYATTRIMELTDDELVGPVVTTRTRPQRLEKGAESQSERVAERQEGHPDLHVWIKVRHLAMDRLVHYSAVALKANVDERRLRLSEQEGQMLVDTITRIVVGLGHTLDKPTRKIIGDELRTTIAMKQDGTVLEVS
jgi:hypothetical protein